MYESTLMSEKDSKQVLDSLTKKSGILIALCALPAFALFAFLGEPGRGRAAAISVFVILLCARIFWGLRRLVVFWLVMAILALCQIPLIFLIPWNNRDYPGIVLLPIALPNFAIIYGILKLVEKLTKSKRLSADSSGSPGT
jgi:hypothetical protein